MSHVIGTESDDVLVGTEENDLIEGLGGNDNISSGAGDDVIVLLGDANYGSDRVLDVAGDDEIHWQGVNASQVERIRFDDFGFGSPDLMLRVMSTGQFLFLANWFVDPSFQIERIVFDDGTVWTVEETSALRFLGTASDDTLSGTGWSELLDGGAGADTMSGAAGDDRYRVDSEGDVIFENADGGIDSVESSVSIMMLWDHVENVTLVGEGLMGVTGNELDNVLIGNDASNVLAGRGGNDTLIGNGGDDYLVDSGGGNDRLVGGAGNDSMLGLEGDDVYEAGIGQDWIYENGGDDEVRMAAGITADEVARMRDGNNIVLRINGTSDQVTLFNWFFDPSYRIERVVFDDGTVWDAATIASGSDIIGTEFGDFITGTELGERIEGRGGHDFIQGLGGDDIIDGGADNDVIDGGDGSDTYFFGFGSGFDSLHESSMFAQGTDVLQLGAGVTGADLLFQGFFGDLVIGLAGTADAVTLRNFLGFGDTVDVIRFADGSQAGIFRADGAQTAYFGTDNIDIFRDSLLTETFSGGQGNDLYVHAAPGGFADTVNDLADASGGNQLIFTTILPTDNLTIGHRDGYLLISHDGFEIVRLSSFDRADILGSHAVDRYTFMDGSSISYAQLLERGFDINGGSGFDELHGTSTFDRIHGNQGDDYLWGYEHNDHLFGDAGDDGLDGGDGDDHLMGGAGDDVLQGGEGSDFYYFTRDSGQDWLLEVVALEDDHGDLDAVAFSSDISPEDLIVSLDALGRLLITVDGSDTSILFNAWFNTEISSRVELFLFEGSSVVLTDEDITAMLNDAPVLAAPIADQLARDAVPFSFTLPEGTFFDDDAGDTLTYTATLSGGGALPSWLLFDAAARTFSGTPDEAEIGSSYSIEVTATDSSGESVADVFELSVDRAPNQTLVGTAGDDVLAGASGDDQIYGNPGNDVLFGGSGNDHLEGNGGSDVLYGGAGDDWLDGGPDGPDTLYGGDGDDVLLEGSVMDGGAGNDELHADATHDAILRGGDGDDFIWSGSGTDVLYGDAGNDYLNGGGGRDEIYGGDGDDRMYEASLMYGGIGNDELHGDATHDNTLYGEDGFDQLWGGSANDLLDGGTGVDVMSGGAGNDRYFVDDLNDAVVESANMGLDTIHSYLSYSLANLANIENLELLGTATSATGNGLANTLRGNDGDNVLDGGAGSDNMNGGAGNDTYMVGQSGDSVTDSAGVDSVISSVSYTLGSSIENLALAGSSSISGTGNSSSNVITGNSGNNTLTGNAGDDTISGGDGNDTLRGGAGNDTLSGGNGTDTFVFSDLPGAANADLVQGFTALDRINLDNAAMSGLGANGNLAASRFWASASGTAHDSSDRVVYSTTTGQLWYDADGNGAGAAQLIATLENAPALALSQISVI